MPQETEALNKGEWLAKLGILQIVTLGLQPGELQPSQFWRELSARMRLDFIAKGTVIYWRGGTHPPRSRDPPTQAGRKDPPPQ